MERVTSISLYFKEGSSDKYYDVELIHDGLYKVQFNYGRVGTSGTSGVKIETPDYELAHDAYTKLINSKIGKGYKIKSSDGSLIGSSGVAHATTTKVDTGVRPHLLTPLGYEEDVIRYIKNTDFVAQEKYDGYRKFLDKAKTKVISINRKGQEVGYPAIFEEALLSMEEEDFLIDGEEVGNIFYAFDILRLGPVNARTYEYVHRYQTLCNIIGIDEHIRVVPIYETEKDKMELFIRLKEEGKEGIVFKHKNSLYSAGRNKDQVKFKFYNTASCMVFANNDGKRSIKLGLLDENQNMIFVGNCTIPSNFPIPENGLVVEIKYLYAYRGGSLYQPIYLGPRDDINVNDCTLDQLKYKNENEEE